MIDPGPKQPENRIHLFDPVGLINEKYSNYNTHPRRATTSSKSSVDTNVATGVREGVSKFAMGPKVSDTDSDTSSPKFWNNNRRNSPPTSPRFTFGNSHHHQQQQQSGNRQSLTYPSFNTYPEPMSPSSRTQAIARGRRELMDMVKDIPESCYELSLRDIVDHKPLTIPQPRPVTPTADVVLQQKLGQQPPLDSKKVEVVEKKFPQQEALESTKEKKGKEKQSKKKKGSKKVGKSESKKKMINKNKSADNGGFLLKTSVFPIPFRSKKKNRGLNSAPSFKVGPKPPSKGSVKGGEKRWWGRKSRVSSDNNVFSGESPSSSECSTRNNNIINRQRLPNHRFLPSCCAFFNDKKMIKAAK